MVKAVVVGVLGRMGRKVIEVIKETKGIELFGSVEEESHPLIGRDIGEVVGLGRMGIGIENNLAKVVKDSDVIIDFTRPQVSLESLKLAVSEGKAIVIGTTGFSREEMTEVKELAPKTRCLLSPNMSVGINLMFKLIKEASKVLKDEYDVEIMEIHHRQKKDAPSGTALKMAEILAQNLGRDLNKVGVYQRKGLIGGRTTEEIGIQSLRAGDIVGEHTVIFGGKGERLEIIHRASSRENFARGAVRAALWIVNQPNGLYDMQDVLGLR